MLAHAFLLSIVSRDHHSNEYIGYEEGADDLKNDEKGLKVGLCLVAWDLVIALGVDHPVLIADPVQSLSHDHHLVHASTDVVVVLVIAAPGATIVQTVDLGLDLSFNLIGSQTRYRGGITVETFTFEKVDCHDSEDKHYE